MGIVTFHPLILPADGSTFTIDNAPGGFRIASAPDAMAIPWDVTGPILMIRSKYNLVKNDASFLSWICT